MAGGTYTWIGTVSSDPSLAANWSFTSGIDNAQHVPQAGDTAIVPGGTTFTPVLLDSLVSGGTLDVVGNGSVQFTNDTIDASNSGIDAVSVINATGTATTLAIVGPLLNTGTIATDGPAGSHLTLTVSGTTLLPGYLINYGRIDVDAGNSMTISVGATSELFNVGNIIVNGGTLTFDAASTAIAGGYAPVAGAMVIEGGGTVETNAAYASGVTGSEPIYEFATAAGNTLKIDNPGSFGGAILGFGQGDTIDLGSPFAVDKIAYSRTTGILNLEDSSGTILSSLHLASGNFQSGSFTVAGGVAGSFNIGTAGDGNTVLTTNVQNDYSNNTSGVWQSAGSWSNGVPGVLDTAFVGVNATGAFTLTTGNAAVSVGALVLTGDNTLLQITSNGSVGPYMVQQSAGTLEVTSGNILTATGFLELGGTTTVDPAASLVLTGHSTLKTVGAVNGTLGVSTTGTLGMQMGGGTLLVNGGTLNAGTGQAGGNGGGLLIGADGAGTPAAMTVQNSGINAGVVLDIYTIVASDPTSFGSLTLSGNVSWADEIDPHDTANTRGYMLVGNNNQVGNAGAATPLPSCGTATLTVENGATLTEQSFASIAASKDSAGNVLVSNALWNMRFLDIGQAGAGTLTVEQAGTVQIGSALTFVSNGSTTTGSGINLGVSAAATGSLTVTDTGSLITDQRGMAVGQAGTGTLHVLNGGTINLTGTAGISAGVSLGAVGTILVSGTDPGSGASALLNAGSSNEGISIGVAGQGMLDVESGGMVQAGGLTIGSTGSLVLGGGTVSASASSTNAGRISGFGAFSGQLTNSGTVSASGGTLTLTGAVANPGSIAITSGAVTITGALTSSGTISLGSGAILSLGSTVSGGTIDFSGSTDGELALGNDTGFSDTVSGLHVGSGGAKTDFIDITGHTVTIGSVSGQGSTSGTITLSDGGVIALSDLGSSVWFANAIGDGNGGTEIFVSDTACYCRGTMILTETGEVAVEELAIGDRVVTLSGEAQPVRWIGRRAFDGRFISQKRETLPIVVRANALADGVPARDLWLSPEHSLYVNGVLAQVKHLLNGVTISQADRVDSVEYFHLELDTHDIVIADGAPAETYIDCDNRLMFANGAEYDAHYPHDDRPRWQFCAPRLEEGSGVLSDLRAALAQRADKLDYSFDCDPEPRLVIGAAEIWPEAIDGLVCRFTVPAGSGALWLASRSTVPAEVDPAARDIRRLGIPVERFVLHDADLRIEVLHSHAGLNQGFHPDESGHRWTDGMARLPDMLLRPFPGAFMLEVQLASRELEYAVAPAVSDTSATA